MVAPATGRYFEQRSHQTAPKLLSHPYPEGHAYVTSNGLRNQGPLDASACRAYNRLPHRQGSRRRSKQIRRGPPRRASAAGGGPLGKATAASHRVSMGMNSATARFRTADLSDPAQRARPHPQLYSHPLERPSSCSGVDRRLRLLLWAKMILPFASNAHHDHGCTGAVEQR